MNERVPLKTCREVLSETGKDLSDDEILAIRDYLYELAEIDRDIFLAIEKRENKLNATENRTDN